MMSVKFNWAPKAYRMLNGVFCIFKPADLSMENMTRVIQGNLARDLNALPCYKHEIQLQPKVITANPTEKALAYNVVPDSLQDLSEHRLVLGPRYIYSDFDIRPVDSLGDKTSGVLIYGIGDLGHEGAEMISDSKFLRVYHVKARFGWATHEFWADGKIIERASFKHVTRPKLDKVLAMAQASHARQMYSYCGVNPDSQEAYELAASGIIRPHTGDTPPILYGVKCIDFQPPDFTLEVHAINENCMYLSRFIHDVAIRSKTAAVCTSIRRLRYGTFDLQRSLVRQQWRLDNFVDNIHDNHELLMPERLFPGPRAQSIDLLSSGIESRGALPQGQALLEKSEDVLNESDSQKARRQAQKVLEEEAGDILDESRVQEASRQSQESENDADEATEHDQLSR